MRRYDVCLGRDRALVFDDVSVFERTCLSEKVDKVVGYGTDCTCNGPRCNQDAKYAAIPVVGKLVQRWQDLTMTCVHLQRNQCFLQLFRTTWTTVWSRPPSSFVDPFKWPSPDCLLAGRKRLRTGETVMFGK